jgi:outer membrane protein
MKASLLLLAALTAPAGAVTLEDAMAAARAHHPSLIIAEAERDAAQGRVAQARAAGLPSLTLSGEAGYGRLDPQGFFGLGGANVTPLGAEAAIEQTLFTGGRVRAAAAAARAGLKASDAGRSRVHADLAADVAAAYGDVLSRQIMRAAWQRLVAQTGEIARQAALRFKAGETPSTEVAQASARLAEAQGGLAGAEAGLATARAHYRGLVGEEPVDLAPLPAGPVPPASLDAAIDIAATNSPAIAEAEAALAAARATQRGAEAERLPSIGAYAQAGVVRDQFFPEYRANAASIGVRARWQLDNGGRISGRIAETSAEARAAEARLRAARQQVEEGVITLYEGLRSARLIAAAAAEQARASEQARTSVAHEVRVGLKPPLALLDAEREVISATARAAEADAMRVTMAYRLSAALGNLS